MSEFRGSIFRKTQTDYCAAISEPPHKRGFDEHNPPGSLFREEQTLHIYGISRPAYVRPELEPLIAPTTNSAPSTTRIEAPGEMVSAPTFQGEFLSSDLSHLTSRRLCLMGAIRLIERAAELGDGDGLTPSQLRPYANNVRSATARFERTIKPKGPFGFLREKLFED